MVKDPAMEQSITLEEAAMPNTNVKAFGPTMTCVAKSNIFSPTTERNKLNFGMPTDFMLVNEMKITYLMGKEPCISMLMKKAKSSIRAFGIEESSKDSEPCLGKTATCKTEFVYLPEHLTSNSRNLV